MPKRTAESPLEKDSKRPRYVMMHAKTVPLLRLYSYFPQVHRVQNNRGHDDI